MKKQTAVEWLIEKLNQCEPMYSGIQSNEHKEYIDKLIQQAQAMEQKQIINAYDEASNKICLSCTDFKIGADYYQINYNKEIGSK